MRAFIILTTVALVLFSFTTVYAQVPPPPTPIESRSGGVELRGEFVPLVGLPGVTDESGNRSLAGYLNTLFRLTIGIGALIAVIKIIWGGIQYMSSDSFFKKAEGISDIKNALLGLLIILSTVLIIRLINPDILNLEVLQGLPPLPVVQLVQPPPSPIAYTPGATSGAVPDDIRRAFDSTLSAGQ